ncbi:MAG: glycosyltransferase family 4 protein, partial [Gemmatimonadota bacterium]|nr:glycosyltransferase family 4 protein [Gemmatimonadota bacterium]
MSTARSTATIEPLRVAFVQQRDARDVRNWSGTLFFSKQAIARYVGPVIDLSPAPISALPLRIARGLVRATTGKSYSYEHDLVIARLYGRYFTEQVRRASPDLIFAPAGSACVAFLKTEVPVIYYSDATWRVMQDYHGGLRKVVKRSARGGEELEQRTLDRAAVALFSSDWAAESAVRDYGADPDKVHTVYIGANLPHPPAREQVLPRRLGDTIRLLLVGVSWQAKGADIAFGALLRLLERGYDAELTVVGCRAPRGVSHPRLRVVPFLNKAIPEQRDQFEQLWREADFFLLPTRFDAAGVVFCEAAAYALPALATHTGGVPSLVVEGRNGYTLPPEAGGAEYAALIAELASDPERYARLCETSRDEFEQRLSWDSWGRRVAEIVAERFLQFRERMPARLW